MTRLQCSACSQSIRLSDEQHARAAGKRVKCPKCSQPCPVPEIEQPEPAPEPPPPLPVFIAEPEPEPTTVPQLQPADEPDLQEVFSDAFDTTGVCLAGDDEQKPLLTMSLPVHQVAGLATLSLFGPVEQ